MADEFVSSAAGRKPNAPPADGLTNNLPHRIAAPVTLADAANSVLFAAIEAANAGSETSATIAGRVGLAVAAFTLPVLWGLIVHLIFNWFGNRRRETPSEDPVMPDYQI